MKTPMRNCWPRCRAHHLADTVHSGPVQTSRVPNGNEDAVDARLSDADRQRFTRPRWDTAQLVALVRERGGDPDMARTDDAALDLDAARWLITERGIPETTLQRIEYQTRLSRRKADQPFVAPIREDARGLPHLRRAATSYDPSSPAHARPILGSFVMSTDTVKHFSFDTLRPPPKWPRTARPPKPR